MEQGSYKIPAEEYHKDPAPEPSLSRSTINDLIHKTPRHAWENHPRLNPEFKNEEKAIFDLGSASHSLLLEGIDKAMVYEGEDWKKKEAQQFRDDARKADFNPLLRRQYDEVKEMIKVAQAFIADAPELKIKSLREEGKAELSYIWKEKGIWYRTRPDWIANNKCLILDYKTTGQLADPGDYERIALNNGLDIQDVLYRRGVNIIDGALPQFVFLVQETKKPYLCSLIELSSQYNLMGEEKIERATQIWRKCMKANHWPGYPSSIAVIDPPAWANAKWEETKLLEDDAYQNTKWSKERLEAEIG
jgi:hypothetical protein